MPTARLPGLVTLVTPPSIFLLDERVFISLGILKIASALEERGVAVEHLDLSGTSNYLEALETHIVSTPSTIVGITATTPQLPTVVKIVERIRALRPEMRIILGGPHVTLTDSAVKVERLANRVSRAHVALTRLQTLADVLVSGDGDKAIFRALEADPPRLIDGDEPQGGFFLTSAMYERTAFPARHLVDMGTYNYEIDGHRSTSLIAQLGCPFGCGFCGGRSSKSLRVIRTRSTESIVSEVKMLHETYGYTGFMFYDDELNVNTNMVGLMNGLSDLQDLLGQEFRFRGFVKSELFTELQATAMYRAGFRWLLSGFESGSPRILKNINKRASLDENTRAVELAKRAGLKIKALMSVGHPGESEHTTRETQEWLLRTEPDEFDCTVITTYPGTPYYDEAVEHQTDAGVWTYTCTNSGDTLHAYDIDFLVVADYYKGDPKGGYRAFVYTDYLTADELVERRNWIEDSVRSALTLAFPQARAALRYEHSSGQGANGALPGFILRRSHAPSGQSGGSPRESLPAVSSTP